MKYIILLIFIVMLCLENFSLSAQVEDQAKLDLPGDNLNLYAVLKLFQDSPTLEGFERTLNEDSARINNLDLDEDGKVDYIQVDDSITDGVHNIILRVAVTSTETQNVAVIIVAKDQTKGEVLTQVVGDEDLYGKDYIIEPDFDDGAATPNPGYIGSTAQTTRAISSSPITYEQPSAWPVIRYIFLPTYVRWRSPWYWNYYPSFWRPWQPLYWHTYYGYQYHWNYYYTVHFRRWSSYRVPGWRDRYYGGGFRSRSPYVQNKYQRGEYRQTYTRPDLAGQGSNLFRKDHPKAPSANVKLPPFDKSGRPIIAKPLKPTPGIKPVGPGPVTTKPVTRPVVTKPVTRPGITKPVITKPVIDRPVTRPVVTKPVISKPVTRPVTRPVVTKPVISKPVTRPVKPSQAQRPVKRLEPIQKER